MWQERLRPLVAAGELAVVGIVQEQHPARARLYRQWRQLDWPLLVDALNLLDLRVVPVPMALDESGRVVDARLSLAELEAFSKARFERVELPKAPGVHPLPGDAPFREGRLDEAVEAYRAALPDARAWFRLGVALRRRHESDARRPGDGQAAVDAWTEALALDPNQYVWRRRLQQYGPRLAKPYNFYGWVEHARREIRARGEEPVSLPVEPRGAELLGRGPAATVQLVDPDPKGAITRDEGLVELETIVTPRRVRPGERVRVRLILRPRSGLWNNEAEPLSAYVPGIAEGLLVHPQGAAPESDEPRVLEFEVEPEKSGPIEGYVLYSVCEKRGGTCLYLRRDFRVAVTVDPDAPRLSR